MEILRVLNKVLVREFFRANAGFFLLVIVLSFGFMSGVEHRALAEFFISSPVTALIPFALSILYTLKIVNFNRQRVNATENLFLHPVIFLKTSTHFAALTSTFVNQFAPAIMYTMFLILVSIQHGQWNIVIELVIQQTALIVTGIFFLRYHIMRAPEEIRISGIKRYIDSRFTKPLVQFYLGWIIRNEIFLFMGTKIFTSLLLFGVTQLYQGESYDWRLMAMGATVAYSANFMIVSQIHRFENIAFGMLRGLPLTLTRRIINYIVVFAMLTLPETLVMFRNFPERLGNSHATLILFFGMSIGLVFYSVHYINGFFEKDLTRLIFLGIILWILFILFKVPLLVLAAANCLAGVWIVTRNFYSFEYSESPDDLGKD